MSSKKKNKKIRKTINKRKRNERETRKRNERNEKWEIRKTIKRQKIKNLTNKLLIILKK